MLITIEHDFRLSNVAYHAKKKPNWYLLHKESRQKIPIPDIRGDHYFKLDVNLNSGYYILGLNLGNKVYEKTFFVNLKGEIHWLLPKAA